MIYKIIANGLVVKKQNSFDRSGRPKFWRELSTYPHLSTIPDLSPQVRIGNSLIFGYPRTPPITSCSWADNPCSYNPGTTHTQYIQGTSISPIAAQSQRNTCDEQAFCLAGKYGTRRNDPAYLSRGWGAEEHTTKSQWWRGILFLRRSSSLPLQEATAGRRALLVCFNFRNISVP